MSEESLAIEAEYYNTFTSKSLWEDIITDKTRNTPNKPKDREARADKNRVKHLRYNLNRLRRRMPYWEGVYTENLNAPIGTKILCACRGCGKRFTKVDKDQSFCQSFCKNRFWEDREMIFGYRKPIGEETDKNQI